MPEPGSLIPKHGGYRKLRAYQIAEIIHDGTVVFCKRAISNRSRTTDQMVQAARSGKQNIAEGSAASATSKKTELKLIGVACASLEELLIDYQDYLRQNDLKLWDKDDPKAIFIRKLGQEKANAYKTYRLYIEEKSLESSANTMICLINQATYLLRRLMKRLELDFLTEGGFTEKLYRERSKRRRSDMSDTLDESDKSDESGHP